MCVCVMYLSRYTVNVISINSNEIYTTKFVLAKIDIIATIATQVNRLGFSSIRLFSLFVFIQDEKIICSREKSGPRLMTATNLV